MIFDVQFTTGLKLKTIIRDFSTGTERLWNTSLNTGAGGFEAYNASNIANYGIATTEGSPGTFSWTVPAALSTSQVGWQYKATTYQIVGPTNMVVGDLATPVEKYAFAWTGTVETDVNKATVTVNAMTATLRAALAGHFAYTSVSTTPASADVYAPTGTFEGLIYYQGVNNGLFMFSHSGVWYITSGLGTTSGAYWTGGGVPAGTYSVQGGASGSPVITIVGNSTQHHYNPGFATTVNETDPPVVVGDYQDGTSPLPGITSLAAQIAALPSFREETVVAAFPDI